MNPSHVEEIIALLWTIAGILLIAANAPRWLVVLFFVKAAFDFTCSGMEAVKNRNTARIEQPTPPTDAPD